jgi:lipopolysaccharide export system permease protein
MHAALFSLYHRHHGFSGSLAVHKERGAGLARGIGYSVLISFVYLVVYSFIVELGKGGTLSPFLAAWLGNFIFAMVGVYLLLSVRH